MALFPSPGKFAPAPPTLTPRETLGVGAKKPLKHKYRTECNNEMYNLNQQRAHNA